VDFLGSENFSVWVGHVRGRLLSFLLTAWRPWRFGEVVHESKAQAAGCTATSDPPYLRTLEQATDGYRCYVILWIIVILLYIIVMPDITSHISSPSKGAPTCFACSLICGAGCTSHRCWICSDWAKCNIARPCLKKLKTQEFRSSAKSISIQ